MKRKGIAIMLVAVLMVCTMALCACGQPDYMWKVGSDKTTYSNENASAYAPTYTVNVKIVSGDDVLYDGTVTLTSDTMWASEFTSAALGEKGLAQEGLSSGFVSKIGDYENKQVGEDYMYWNFSVNGVSSNWGCNEVHVLDGMYILWEYIASTF